MNPLPANLPGSWSGFSVRTFDKRLITLFVLFFVLLTSRGFAQDVIWMDRFEQGIAPTEEQCRRWADFLAALGGEKKFGSVTLSGEFDQTGKTITDLDAATQLAKLLATKTPGTVVSDGSIWAVTHCDVSNCYDGFSLSLSVDGNTEQCDCDDRYVIRPQSRNASWGGINTETSCGAKSQYMKLEFREAVSIVSDGNGSLCDGGEVVLTAQSQICSSARQYEWSNGETTASITVTQPGDYTVTVYNNSGCSATSSPFTVTGTASVDAGQDLLTCNQPVQLNATALSTGSGPSTMVNKVCMFDAPGGQGLCNFVARNVCQEGMTPVGNATFSKDVSFDNPVELRFKLYYSADWYADFIFKVNGHQVGSYREGDPSSTCDPIGSVRVPRTIVVAEHQFRHHWKEGSENRLTIDIVGLEGGIRLAGLVAEVVTSSESFIWSPAEGLSATTVANPVAQPQVTTTYTVTYTDANGCVASDMVKVEVDETVPVFVTVSDRTLTNDPGECFATFELPQPEVSDNCGLQSLVADFEGAVFPIGETIVTWTATDVNGNESTAIQRVTVLNAVPEITSVVASVSPAVANTSMTLSITQTDNNISTATIDWGDGTEAETIAQPETSFDVSHVYEASGSYSATITLTDECGATAYVYEAITVIGAQSGSVSGGGWFDSPRGAYVSNPRASGKATFAFDVSNESRLGGAEGHINFNFKDGNIKFRSTEIESLDVAPLSARMSAVGRLNGIYGYRIFISVREDDSQDAGSVTTYNNGKDKNKHKGKKLDYIRVRISNPSGKVIYDTQMKQMDQALPVTQVNGSIKVAPSESVFERSPSSPVASSSGEESSSAYPNPFRDWVDIQFSSGSPEHVAISVIDLSGKVVFNQVFPVSPDGHYALNIFEEGQGRPGIYVAVIKQGKRVTFLRLVHE